MRVCKCLSQYSSGTRWECHASTIQKHVKEGKKSQLYIACNQRNRESLVLSAHLRQTGFLWCQVTPLSINKVSNVNSKYGVHHVTNCSQEIAIQCIYKHGLVLFTHNYNKHIGISWWQVGRKKKAQDEGEEIAIDVFPHCLLMARSDNLLVHACGAIRKAVKKCLRNHFAAYVYVHENTSCMN